MLCRRCSKDVTIGTGKTENVTFPAGPGPTTATVAFKDMSATITLVWQNPGAVCAPPELPKTGDNIGGFVAGGAALVALGAGLLLYVRRRRIRMAA
jgi:LPXTG-motif cell wall-anchored protein